MKRTIFWLLASIFTFALGVAIVFVWLNDHKLPNQQSEVSSSTIQKADTPKEMPILAYCELANNPEKYNGKVVRVRAKLNHFIHGPFFADDNCADSGKTTAVIFSPKLENEIINKLKSKTKSEKFSFWDAEIIAVGKFSRVKPTQESDALVDNIDLRFEILEIEQGFKNYGTSKNLIDVRAK